MALGALAGFTVGITADRRWEEQAMLLERRGARVVHGPSIRTLPLHDEPELAGATEALIAGPPAVVVLTTGLGARGWFASAASVGRDGALLAALSSARVLARGPKAAGAAITHGLAVEWRAPGERSAEVLDHLGSVDGVRIAVQRDGGAAPDLADALRDRGADVVDVPVYRWVVPDDVTAARRLVDGACARQVDAITFTSAPAVVNLLAIAGDRRRDLLDAMVADVAVICVGPVCADAARHAGIPSAQAPDPGRLGAMVRVVEEVFAGRARRASLAGVDLLVQGSTVVVEGEARTLSDRERAVLDALLDAGGAVVSKSDLVERVWAGAADAHTVEVAVARLRTRLGPAGHGIVAVPRRGYRATP